MTVLAVVIGVIVNGAGEILLAKRAAHQHQGGLWEFPGGKLEIGEAPLAGLWRELQEELGISIIKAQPLIQIHHEYPDKTVLLDVFRVSEFDGIPLGREGQPLAWVRPSDLNHYPLPAANTPIVNALRLPGLVCISGAAPSPSAWLAQCSASLRPDMAMLARPYHEDQLAWPWADLLPAAFNLCRANGAQLWLHAKLLPQVINQYNPSEPGESLEPLRGLCHGLHLPASWVAYRAIKLPDGLSLGMSCHNQQQLQQAVELNCQYALLSPVLPTQTHPEAKALGWSEFAHLCRAAKVPVFALGGVTGGHMELAQVLGAQGVAGIRSFWLTKI